MKKQKLHSIRLVRLLLAVMAITFASCSEVFDDSVHLSHYATRSISVNPSSLQLTAAQQSKTVNVVAENLSWAIDNNATWVTFSPDRSETSATVTAAVKANDTEDARTSIVQVKSTIANLPRYKEVTVTQDAQKADLSLNKSLLEFDSSEGRQAVQVSTHRQWSYDTPQSWITCSVDGKTLYVSVSANVGDASREGYVNVTSGGENKQIKVVQRSGKVTASRDKLEFDNAASSESVSIEAMSDWRAECGQSWIDVSPMSGQAGSSRMTISVTDNIDEGTRVGYIYLYVGNDKKEEITVTQNGTKLSVSPNELSFESVASSNKITITANAPWSLSVPDDKKWVHIDKTEGTGNATVQVSVDANMSDKRDATIALKNKVGNTVSEVKVVQQAPLLTCVPRSLSFTILGGEGHLYLSGDVEWRADSPDTWISLDKTSGENPQLEDITVTVEKNPSTSEREGTVLFYDKEGNVVLAIPIVQSASAIAVSTSELQFSPSGSTESFQIETAESWSLTCPDWLSLSDTKGRNSATITASATPNETSVDRVGRIEVLNEVGVTIASIEVLQPAMSVKVEPSSYQYAVGGGRASFSVESNTSWEASSSASWLSISRAQGNGNASLTITASENTASVARSESVLFRSASGKTLFEFTVTQEGASIAATPQSLEFTVDGGSKPLSIASNTGWNVITPDAWISLSQSSGSGDGSIQVTASANTSKSARTGSVVLQNSVGQTVQTISVSQYGTSISATPTSLSFEVNGGTNTLTITGNSSWALATNDSWITLSDKSGSGNGTVRVTASANTQKTSRSGSIVLRNASGETMQTITVGQVGTSMSATPTSVGFQVDGGSETLTISGNSSWTLTTTATWFTLSATSGSGSGSVTVKAGANTSSNMRSGSLALKNASGETMQTISVTQQGVMITATPATLSFANAGESLNVSVSSNSSWSVSAPAWLTLSASSGTGNTTLKATAGQNTTSLDRTGVLTFKTPAGETVQEVTVTQACYVLDATPTSVSCEQTARNVPITLTANSAWTASCPASWITLDKTSGTGSATLNLSVQANTTDATRSTDVTIVSGPFTKTVHVSQAYSVVLSCTPTSLSYPVDGSTQELNISSNSSWTLSTSADWLTIGTPSGRGNATVKLTATANANKSVRTANLLLKNVNGETVQTISVTQTALSLSATLGSNKFTYEGGTTHLTITANVGWTIAAPAWIHCSAERGTGQAELSVSVEALSEHTGRTGSIVITDLSGKASITLNIEQQGKPQTQDLERDLQYIFPSAGGDLKLSTYETSSWTAQVTSGASWISLSPSSGGSTTELVITTADNPSGKQRTGYIQVTYGFNRYTSAVVQAGKSITVSTSTVDFFAKGGESQAITITADKTATISKDADWLTIKQSGNVFTLTATKNASSSMRTGKVAITLSGVSDLPATTITVRQAGVNGTFTFDDFGEDQNWN